MKVNKVRQITKLPKQTIYYYEKEGLVIPQRLENGYREYTIEDVDTLILIKKFRDFDMSIEDVKAVLDGKKDLEICLKQKVIEKEQSLLDLEQMIAKLKYVKGKHVPTSLLVEDVLYQKEVKPTFFYKVNEQVSIGRRINRKLLIKKFLLLLLFVIPFMFLAASAPKAWELTGVAAVVYLIAVYGFLTGLLIYDVYGIFIANRFIEFNEHGVVIFDVSNPIKVTQVIKHILMKDDLTYFDTIPYEDIVKVILDADRVYVPVRTFPTLMARMIFKIEFINNKSFVTKTTLGISRKDLSLLMHIIEHKQIPLRDDKNLFEVYKQQHNLLDYMIENEIA